MWILKSKRGETYYLLPGKQHVVGRKGGDIMLADDQSISRRHAAFLVEHPIENWDDPNKLPIVKIIETSSKYGTIINPECNGTRMLQNSTQQLKNGDEVQFGVQWNIWRLVHEPLVVVVSTLTAKQKKTVKDIIGNLGGHTISNWQPVCTHLTMCNLLMTIKAISALSYGRKIVTPDYWVTYKAAIESRKELPNYEDFIPPLAETVINKNEVSFQINKKRRTLFEGKCFIFFSESQYNEHACLVTASGGTANILEKNVFLLKELIQPHIIVIQHVCHSSSVDSDTPQRSIEVASYLQSHGKRVVPVNEIGLAILHCSIDKYCNPAFNFAAVVLSSNRNSVPSLKSQEILASETQEDEMPDTQRKLSNMKDKVIIPESGTVSKQKKDIQKTEESDQTLLMESPRSFPSGSTTRNKQTLLSNYLKTKSLKRPRNAEDKSDITVPAKRSNQMKFGKKSNTDSDDEGLFDFANEPKRSIRDEDKDDDLFAFKDEVCAENRHASQLSLSTDALNTVTNLKRKLSSEEESSISDHCEKKLAVGTISNKLGAYIGEAPNNSRVDYGFSYNTQCNADFLSSEMKKEKSSWKEDCPSSNMSLVTVKSLVVTQPISEDRNMTNLTERCDKKNFKKFRKIKASIQSTDIICAKRLIPFQNNAAASNPLFDDNSDDERNEPDDWAFSTVSQMKRKGYTRRL